MVSFIIGELNFMQETFNTIVRHLRAQNQKAFNPNHGPSGMCYYRYKDLKCAAGAIIPDELYERGMEGIPICAVNESFNLRLEHIELVQSMQYVHDNWEPIDWEEQFIVVAKEFDLVVPN